jgi:hypothetical protein
MCCGCNSTVSPVYDVNGHFVSVTSTKVPFGPDIEYEREWEQMAPDGKTVLHFKERCATHTTADRVASVLGAILEGWDKVKL